MLEWITALSLACFVATIPLLWVLRVLRELPEPLVGSHTRWPVWANVLLIGALTLYVAFFIRGVYAGGPREPMAFVFQFLIAVVIYFFGFVLLTRQFEGLYPEYFVTMGRTGFGMRKALYRNVVDVEEVNASGPDTELRMHMRTGEKLQLCIPTHHLPTLYETIRDSQPEL